MYTLDTIKKIILINSLQNDQFYLISHPAQKNWRQINDSIEKKLSNSDIGLVFDKYSPQKIAGKELLQLSSFEKFTTQEKPIVSICSKFTDSDSNTDKHLMMMNIHLDNYIGLDKLAEFISAITNSRFWILKTDRFYHIYAQNIMTDEGWKLWNLKYLMLDSLVSPRYIGHSLERGFNLLRTNSTCNIKTIQPYIVYDSEEINNG